MKILLAGYDQDRTRQLSEQLRAAGHQVLGAVGRHGARTFVKVVTPDCVLVPVGAAGERVQEWLEGLTDGLMWVSLGDAEDPVAVLSAMGLGDGAEAGAPAVGPAGADAEPELLAPRMRTFRAEAVAAEAWDVAARTAPFDRPAEEGRGDATAARRLRRDPLSRRQETRRADPRPSAPLRPAAEAEPPPIPPREARPPESGDRDGGAADGGPVATLSYGDDASEEPPGAASEADPDLVSKLAHVRFGDYHSVLELEPDASAYAVREQYKRLSTLYSPRGWPKRLGPDELGTLQEIARGLRDAFVILGDPELRARYERALLGASTPRS